LTPVTVLDEGEIEVVMIANLKEPVDAVYLVGPV
jgi:hypothetical protein